MVTAVEIPSASIVSYLLARVLQIEGCCSCLVWATRGIGAGAVLATIELRLLLLEAGDRLVAKSIYCRLTLYVDDATIETVGASSSVVSVHAGSVNRFVADLHRLRLQFWLQV